MSWIKRNLYFVVGSLAAVILLGLAGFYNFTRMKANSEKQHEVESLYDQLRDLNRQRPHPGNELVNNVEIARKQEEEVRETLKRLAEAFTPIPAIPPGANVTSVEYAGALRRTIDALQRDATNASVVLPPQYDFSFSRQRRLMNFDPNSLRPLAVQLGEVKAIVDILNQAKINSLDAIRRERVSVDDGKGPATDYLGRISETNELAVTSPYEVEFKCFSPELAAVLSGFANSSYGLLIKSLNVEPATTLGLGPGGYPTVETPTYTPPAYPTYTPPAYTPPTPQRGSEYEMEGGGGRYPTPTYPGRGAYPTPAYPTPAYPTMTTPVQRPPANETVIDEKQLRVTLLVYVVKLLPKE